MGLKNPTPSISTLWIYPMWTCSQQIHCPWTRHVDSPSCQLCQPKHLQSGSMNSMNQKIIRMLLPSIKRISGASPMRKFQQPKSPILLIMRKQRSIEPTADLSEGQVNSGLKKVLVQGQRKGSKSCFVKIFVVDSWLPMFLSHSLTTPCCKRLWRSTWRLFFQTLPPFEERLLHGCYDDCMSALQADLQDCSFYMAMDETNDGVGRYVANVLLGKLDVNGYESPYLVSVSTMKKAPKSISVLSQKIL